MADVEDLKIVFRAEVDKAISDLKKASKAGKDSSKDWNGIANNFAKSAKQSLSLKNAFGQLSMQVAGGIGIYQLASKAVQALGQFAQESVKEYQGAAESQAKLAAQVKATGGAAGYTAGQLVAMADELQDATLIDDDEIRDAQSALLKFTGVTGDSFKEATSLALDLSRVLGTDASSAAQTLGKALEDPAGGMGALKKAGVVLSDQQEKLVKSMIATGDAAGAQALILKEVEARVGGVAASISKEDPGNLKGLSVAMKELKEQAGRGFSAAMAPVNQLLAEMARNAADAAKGANDLREARAGATDTTKIQGAITELKRQYQELSDQGPFGGGPDTSADEIYESEKNALKTEIALMQARLRLVQETALAERDPTKGLGTKPQKGDDDDELAAAHIAAVDVELKKKIQTMKLEASVQGEEISKQSELDAYTSAYVKLISESNGLITAANPAAKAYAAVISDLSGEVDAAAQAELEKAAAQKKAEEIGGRVNALYQQTSEGIAAAKAETLAFAEAQLAAAEAAGADSEELGKLQAVVQNLKTEVPKTDKVLDTFHDDLVKAMDQSLAQGLVNGFEEIGSALASGDDAAGAFGSAMTKMAADMLKQTATLALTAGLRLLAEGGLAMLPAALGLFALAGISAIAGGAFASATSGPREVDYEQYITDPVVEAEKKLAEERLQILSDQLDREKEIRDEKLKELEGYFDQEYEVLKDQWNRGRISTEQYQASATALRGQEASTTAAAEQPYKDAEAAKAAEEARQKAAAEALENARKEKLSALASAAKRLQDLLNSMSGAEKFFTNHDEEITKQLNLIDRRMTVTQNARTIDEIKAAAYGADYVTSGPELLMVGDNSTGKERVRVEPIGSPNIYGPQGEGGITINFQGPVYGLEDLYAQLDEIGARLGRHGRIAMGAFY